ncbi:hypothetical protein SARC_14860 [Sphaeroforma arctica JP610]|uniref:Uncharacterized protein n=1 Tax=Sphaeroforma arctica JP610 TaxID=667725 RepID=A0A0L0F784_9EUKA|nr:hypothetical protein SARC_14860 [Sphaeroforma arctica JP610]KNC72582.1 hypothetical protein SARC_14860 [Sphaeroforma arctica JP610]|eukprot:XP_014146484.1 hypothetical protein SARC_14860 [Sphaeroforma arctica JP610]
MSMHISMLTLAPQYVMFGSQTYINNGTIVPCETSPHDGGVCTITRAAAFSQRLSYNYPVFGAVVFGMNWLFLFIVALATPVVIIVQRRPTLKHDLGGVMGMAGTDRTNNRSASARDRDNRPLTAGIGLDDGDDDSDYDDFDDYNEMESL